MKPQINTIIHQLSAKEKKELLEKLNEKFGISKIKGILFKIGAERIRLFTGELTEKELNAFLENIRIEGIGVSILKEEKGELRLSIEGAQLFGSQVSKNILQLKDNQLEPWMYGEDILQKNERRGYILVKHNEDFLGSGKLGAEKISNFVPKPRRLIRKESK
jgi:NOL1/NOP2/fmu family ribosome biogenesis protein